MSLFYISEFSHLSRDPSNNSVVAPLVPAGVEQNVTIGGTSAQSAAFGVNTGYIMVTSDAAAYLAFGANPTATTGYHRISASETRFYSVMPGSKVAVLGV